MDRSSPAPSFPFPDDNNDNVDITRQAEEEKRDRDAVIAAHRKEADHVAYGLSLGLASGVVLALCLRRGRTRLFEAMKVGERPVAVILGDGRAGEFLSCECWALLLSRHSIRWLTIPWAVDCGF